MFGTLFSTWFLDEAWNWKRKLNLLQEFEEQGEVVTGIVIQQRQVLHSVNLIPTGRSHVIDFQYHVSSGAVNSEDYVRVTGSVAQHYNIFQDIELFSSPFDVTILPGYPLSGYPTLWVQRRSGYFYPNSGSTLLTFLGVIYFANVVAMMGLANVPKNVVMLLLFGVPFADCSFRRWKRRMLGVKICSRQRPEYNRVPEGNGTDIA
jgi:hypothetical protein